MSYQLYAISYSKRAAIRPTKNSISTIVTHHEAKKTCRERVRSLLVALIVKGVVHLVLHHPYTHFALTNINILLKRRHPARAPNSYTIFPHHWHWACVPYAGCISVHHYQHTHAPISTSSPTDWCSDRMGGSEGCVSSIFIVVTLGSR